MSYEVADLTAKVVTILAPFSPMLTGFLKTTGEELARWIAQRGGEQAWKFASLVWEKIQARFGDDLEVVSATNMVAVQPDNPTRQIELAQVLAKRFNENPNLVKELIEFLDSNKENIQEVTANQGSLIEGITQEISGDGKQTIRADQKSTIKNVKQQRHR